MKTAHKISSPNLRADWCVIGIDETEYWNLAPELMAHVDRILGVYAFNRSVHTYCCCITPAYWLECLTFEAVLKPDTPDAIADKIHDEVLSVPRHDSSHYQDVASIDRQATKSDFFAKYGPGESEANEPALPDWLAESWAANPQF